MENKVRIDFFYIVKKIISKIQIKILQHKFILENIYPKNLPSNTKSIKSILLYFPDYKIMHLGDHLFFEPLARALKQNGYEVKIQPAPIMQFYFDQLGYACGNIDCNFDLVITRLEFLASLSEYNGFCLFIDTANASIKKPICFDIIEKVFKILNIAVNNIDDKPKLIKNLNLKDFGLKNNEKYILFNNYIDSGAFRIGARHQKALINFTKQLKKQTGYKVIHIGSLMDTEKDTIKYDFIDIDLRGKTSVSEIFDLISYENIIYNISYDAFIMHLFFLVNKHSFILFRGRFLKKNTDLMLNCINPPFYVDNKDDVITYIPIKG